MFGFAVDVFRPEVRRQDRYARAGGGRPRELWKRHARYHGNTEGSCKGGAHAAVRAPLCGQLRARRSIRDGSAEPLRDRIVEVL